MEVVNKIAQSGLITLDLETFLEDVIIDSFDMKSFLYKEFVLKEADFRDALNHYDWSKHAGHYLAVYCSNDAIIANWAYMLVVVHAKHHVKDIYWGDSALVQENIVIRKLRSYDWNRFKGKRVILKGCGKLNLSAHVYLEATTQLVPFADRIMYGEACSFVPVYRK